MKFQGRNAQINLVICRTNMAFSWVSIQQSWIQLTSPGIASCPVLRMLRIDLTLVPWNAVCHFSKTRWTFSNRLSTLNGKRASIELVKEPKKKVQLQYFWQTLSWLLTEFSTSGVKSLFNWFSEIDVLASHCSWRLQAQSSHPTLYLQGNKFCLNIGESLLS